MIEIPIEDDNSFGERDSLACPLCGENLLHQEEVTSIFRDSEDGDGTEVTQKTNLLIAERVKNAEIEGRRDVLYIRFYCENCDWDPEHLISKRGSLLLCILQHKGCTYITWKKSNPLMKEVK